MSSSSSSSSGSSSSGGSSRSNSMSSSDSSGTNSTESSITAPPPAAAAPAPPPPAVRPPTILTGKKIVLPARGALPPAAAAMSGKGPVTSAPPSSAAPVPLAAVSQRAFNRTLSYAHPDNIRITIPSLHTSTNLFTALDTDRTNFPYRKFRFVDYLLTAVDLYLEEVAAECKRQAESLAKSGKEFKRFTWGNKGDLAICYATALDMLKLLFDQLADGPGKPRWDALVDQFIAFLMRKSNIPVDVLSDKTYHTKYLDWKKGGTRYQNEISANIRLPSAEERLKKLETYIGSGKEYEVHSTVVEVVRVDDATGASGTAAPAAGSSSAVSGAAAAQPVPTQLPPGVVVRGKAPPTGVAAVRQPHDTSKAQQWLQALNNVKGNPGLLLLPKDRIHLMPVFLTSVCLLSDSAEQWCTVVDLINQSPTDIQLAFEHQGGLTYVRRWLALALAQGNEQAVRALAERTAAMQLKYWHAPTRANWLNGGKNLDWLRTMEFRNILRPQMWNETIARLESLAKTPHHEEIGGAGASTAGATNDTAEGLRKRERGDDYLDSAASSRRAAAVPVRVTELPADLQLRIPDDCTSLESSTIRELLRRRQRYADDHQRLLEQRLRAAQEGQHKGTPVGWKGVQMPLWYDPYSLLGICKEDIVSWM